MRMMEKIGVGEFFAVLDCDLCGSFGALRSDADICASLLSTLL
jgi:hypothetical protein